MGLARMHRRLLKRLGQLEATAYGGVAGCPSCEAYSLERFTRVARQVSALLGPCGGSGKKRRVCLERAEGSPQAGEEASGLLEGRMQRVPQVMTDIGSGTFLQNQSSRFLDLSLKQTPTSFDHALDHTSPFFDHPLVQNPTLRCLGVLSASNPGSGMRSFSTTTPSSSPARHLAQSGVSATPLFTPPFHRSPNDAANATSQIGRRATTSARERTDLAFSPRGSQRRISTSAGSPQKSSLGSWFSSLWGGSSEAPAVSPTEAPAGAKAPGVRQIDGPAAENSGAPGVSGATEEPTRPGRATRKNTKRLALWWDCQRKAKVSNTGSSEETMGLEEDSMEEGSESTQRGWRGRNGRGKRMDAYVLGKHEHGLRENQIPETAWFVLRKLQSAGYDSYLAGGVVRDLLLGRTPKDVDIVTSASPKQVKKAVPRTMVIGRRFQIARVHVDGSEIEVSSFGTVSRPSKAIGTSPGARADVSRDKLLDDLRANIGKGVTHLAASALKRDVTINSLLYDPFKLVLYDFCGGMDDLARKKIRTIIDPEESFAEDPARILRVIRIAARTGFRLTPEVSRAATKMGSTALVSLDRSRSQMELAVMMGYGASERSVRLLWRTGLLKYLLPLQADYFAAQNAPPTMSTDRSDLLLEYLRRLDSFTTAAAPCHSALWIALLALHLAQHQLNSRPLVILTLVKAITKDSAERGLRHGFADAQTHLLKTSDERLAAARRELEEVLSVGLNGTERDGAEGNGTEENGTVPTRLERFKFWKKLRQQTGEEKSFLGGTAQIGMGRNGTGQSGTDESGTGQIEIGQNGTDASETETDGTESHGTDASELDANGTDPEARTESGTDVDGTESLPAWAEEGLAQHEARWKFFAETVKPGAEALAERAAEIVQEMALDSDGAAGRAITRADAARASALFALVANRSSPEVAAYCASVKQSRRTRLDTNGPPPKRRAVKVALADLKVGRIEDLAEALCVIVGKAVAPVPPRKGTEGGKEGED